MGIGDGWWVLATPKCYADILDAKEAQVRVQGGTSENVT